MKVWRAGKLPPIKVTTRELGVNTQWATWRCPVQRKWVVTFQQAMMRVRALGLQQSVHRQLEMTASFSMVKDIRIAWRCGVRLINWYEVDYRVKWDSAHVLCAGFAPSRRDFGGLETGLKVLKPFDFLTVPLVSWTKRNALNVALGGVRHETRAHNVFPLVTFACYWRWWTAL
eukprot:3781883-Amphidinium_carterae.1